MCPPLLAAIGGVVSTVGAGVGALQAAAADRYKANVAEQDAQFQSQAGNDAAIAGRRQAQDLYRKLGQAEGAQRTRMAAGGVDLGFGSSLQAQQDTAADGADQAQSLYDQTAQNVRGFDVNAAGDQAKATAARMEGDAALTKGVFDAGSNILGDVSQFGRLSGRSIKSVLGRTKVGLP